MPGTAPLLLHVFVSFATGGPQVRFATLVNRLGERFSHAVLAMDGRLDARALLDPALDIRFPEVKVIKKDPSGNVRRFRAALRAIDPDLLVTSNWGSIEWALARIGTGVPHLHLEDGFGPEERARQLPRRVLARRILLRRTTVVVPSRQLWRIANETWRLPRSNIRLLSNGIDVARFSAVRPRENAEPIVIGTVAALRPEKNIARLIRAMALIADTVPVRLVVVGDGPERAALEALTTALGIDGKVEFVGHRTDPAPFYAAFDIFALSSDTEQMPLSVLEAMASGLPVVSTNVGDVATMLDTANRSCVVPQEDNALADALRSLAMKPELRAFLGSANRARAESEFAEGDMVAAWSDLFSALARRRSVDRGRSSTQE